MEQLERMKIRRLPTEEGAWDRENIKALRKSIRGHLSLPLFESSDPIPPGYSQVSFNALLHESALAQDGAEKRHAPNVDWKFRVWTGGELTFNHPKLFLNSANKPHHVAVKERITDARLIGALDDKNARVLVTLTKVLFLSDRSPEGRPVYTDLGRLSVRKTRNTEMVKEEKHLCFWREIPSSLRESSARRLPFPSNPDYFQTMVPSPTLLFRFSSLTRNAHAIHLDGDYTQKVYGLPKLIVHGPLTSVLMLDVLGEALAIQSTKEPLPFAVRQFNYKNLLPLFVNEQITIACRKMRKLPPQEGKYKAVDGIWWEQWEVWIQRGEGDEATLAVRGTALVSPVRKSGSRGINEDFVEQVKPADEELSNPSRTA
ncbi:hypothetical protein H2200_002946 [Cladophialophora chaetospira]|uniref:Hydroxyacyl-thioester dehydratase type 2, mitochondrial n=1 Tax=Cladophialophora chaetospira TaxID=386627 RepID=A0AA38XGF3_9EURO|nr:hypothetical protein H2200_002946 [Cladophialophora chaetospira]